MKKRILAAVLLIVMLMSMAACGAKPAPAATTAPATEAPKDLGALVSADTNDLMLYVDLWQIAAVGHQEAGGYACSCFAQAWASSLSGSQGRIAPRRTKKSIT